MLYTPRILNVKSNGTPKLAGGVNAAIWVLFGMIRPIKRAGRSVDVYPFVVIMSFEVAMFPLGVWTCQRLDAFRPDDRWIDVAGVCVNKVNLLLASSRLVRIACT